MFNWVRERKTVSELDRRKMIGQKMAVENCGGDDMPKIAWLLGVNDSD